MELIQDFDNADTISIDTLALFEDIEEKRAREISELNRLSKKVCFLHTKVLYYRNSHSELGAACLKAWRNMIKCVEGSANCWRDLGHHLGIAQDDLDYIKHSPKYDPTDTILKVFMQDEDATIDKIIDAFVKMKRYDILNKIEEPLLDMAACFNKDESKSDAGYHSNTIEGDKKKIITFETLHNDLPLALSKKSFYEEKKPPNKPFEAKRPDIVREISMIKNDVPILFLSYSEDGLETAWKIQEKVNSWSEDLNVQVITLNDRKEDVLQNPAKFIREYFEKADYLVPIITPDYLDEINSFGPGIPSTSDNLDCKYVKFIYNLIVNQYMHVTGCLNKKVRSVLPRSADVSVLMDISMYPALMPWTHENSFDEQFKIFLKDFL